MVGEHLVVDVADLLSDMKERAHPVNDLEVVWRLYLQDSNGHAVEDVRPKSIANLGGKVNHRAQVLAKMIRRGQVVLADSDEDTV